MVNNLMLRAFDSQFFVPGLRTFWLIFSGHQRQLLRATISKCCWLYPFEVDWKIFLRSFSPLFVRIFIIRIRKLRFHLPILGSAVFLGLPSVYVHIRLRKRNCLHVCLIILTPNPIFKSHVSSSVS